MIIKTDKNEALFKFLEQSNAIEDVFDKKSLENSVLAWEFIIENKITLENILKTHKVLMENSDLKPNEKGSLREKEVVVGKWKITGINPITNTVTKKFVKTGKIMSYKDIKTAMDNWIVLANMTLNFRKKTFDFINKVEKEIIEDHIVFEKIHPFIDGNGRIGRILLNYMRIKLGLPFLIIWADEREDYYKLFKHGLGTN